MTRQKFVEQYLTPSTASTVATRKATVQDKHKATGSASVDFHVDNATTKE